jgi:hypothetical protein
MKACEKTLRQTLGAYSVMFNAAKKGSMLALRSIIPFCGYSYVSIVINKE